MSHPPWRMSHFHHLVVSIILLTFLYTSNSLQCRSIRLSGLEISSSTHFSSKSGSITSSIPSPLPQLPKATFGTASTYVTASLTRYSTPKAYLLPVLHNLEPEIAPLIYKELNDLGFTSCSVSLRHGNAMQALESLSKIMYSQNGKGNAFTTIGASSLVAEEQLLQCVKLGTNFVSTMYLCKPIMVLARQHHMCVLAGVQTLSDAQEAITYGASALKFFPSTNISPENLRDIIDKLNTHDSSHNLLDTTDAQDNDKRLSLYIAGGIKPHDCDNYISSGATGFAVGIDCKQSMIEVRASLVSYMESLTTSFSPESKQIPTASFTSSASSSLP